jgi:hypothetical protein
MIEDAENEADEAEYPESNSLERVFTLRLWTTTSPNFVAGNATGNLDELGIREYFGLWQLTS